MFTATLSPEVITELVGTVPVSTGRECRFIPFDSQWGLKLYTAPGPRNRGLEKQIRLFEMGLAPTPGEAFEIEWQGRHWYGYSTEIVQTVVNNVGGTNGIGNPYNRNDLYEQVEQYEFREQYEADVRDLFDRCAEAGVTYDDDHPANHGYNRDGVLVILDCGDVGMGD